jgi:hypothetical protein
VQRDLQELEAAKKSYQEALEIRRQLERQRPGVYLNDVASTLNNLGNVQRDLQELEAAKQSYQEAEAIYRQLERQRPGVYLNEVASTLIGMGNLQSALQELEAAKQSYQEALEIFRQLERQRPGVYLSVVATTLNNLGNVQSDLQKLEAAKQSYQEAEKHMRQLAQRDPTAHLPLQRMCLKNLGLLYLSESPGQGWPDHHAARDCFRQARDIALKQRGMLKDADNRTRLQEANANIFDSLAKVNLQIWEIENDLDALQECLTVAEQGRSRNLLEMLAEETLAAKNAPLELVEEFRTLRKQARQARMRLQHEESRSVQAPPKDDKPKPSDGTKTRDLDFDLAADRIVHSEERIQFVRQELAKLEQQERTTLAKIQKHDNEFNPDDPVPPVSIEEIRQLLPTDKRTAFLSYTITSDRGFAVLVTREEIHAVALPQMSIGECDQLRRNWLTVYYTQKDEWPEAIPDLLEPVAERAVRPAGCRVAATADRAAGDCPASQFASLSAPCLQAERWAISG